ncbi:hypothetical protein L596_020243 [Steinernema carpocapsae]|uniref:Protein kinase domain-containing protein n=1 Tax=Steinernema carpocapsae TaxID=34508 RepID=A0A4U5MT07_STECR|nr:hypothetical protein L596_020243 [Steinernema carpocapsae]
MRNPAKNAQIRYKIRPLPLIALTCCRCCCRLFKAVLKSRQQQLSIQTCCRATVAGLVAGGCSNSCCRSCCPATGQQQPRRRQHEFEHPVAVAVAVAVVVAGEFERHIRNVSRIHFSSCETFLNEVVHVYKLKTMLGNVSQVCNQNNANLLTQKQRFHTSNKARIQDNALSRFIRRLCIAFHSFLAIIRAEFQPPQRIFLNLITMDPSEATVPLPSQTTSSGVNYVFSRTLGAGSFGTVCQMISQDGTSIALKVMKNDNLERQQQNRREVAIMMRLTHQNIVQFFAASDVGLSTWIAMEFAAFGTLEQKIYDKRQPYFKIAEIRDLFRQIVSAVKYMHMSKITHCDLKPGNMLLTQGNVVKICDFGLAHWFRLNTHGFEMPGAPDNTNIYGTKPYLGTEAYNSPVKSLGQWSIGTKDDVWSLGITLFVLLNRSYPWLKAVPSDNLYFQYYWFGKLQSKVKISKKTRQVLDSCLRVEELQRPNIQQISLMEYVLPDMPETVECTPFIGHYNVVNLPGNNRRQGVPISQLL